MQSNPFSYYNIPKSNCSQVCVFASFHSLRDCRFWVGKISFCTEKHNPIATPKHTENKDFSTKSTAFSTSLCKFEFRQKVQKTDFFHLQPTALFLSRLFSCGENRAAADAVGSCLSQFVGSLLHICEKTFLRRKCGGMFFKRSHRVLHSRRRLCSLTDAAYPLRVRSECANASECIERSAENSSKMLGIFDETICWAGCRRYRSTPAHQRCQTRSGFCG